jgi:hypothetical protein
MEAAFLKHNLKTVLKCIGIKRLVHVTRHFADQVLKKKFSSRTDLNELLDAVIYADYKFDGIEKNRFLNFQKSYFEFSNQQFFFTKCQEIYHSMQNFILYIMTYLVLTLVARDNWSILIQFPAYCTIHEVPCRCIDLVLA